MHKGIMILTKAENKEDALTKVREFLKDYKGKVWDWYQVGGRWTSTLSPLNKKFIEESDKILVKTEHGLLSQNEVDSKQNELQAIWEKLGGKGSNPYADHYRLPDDGGEYDIMQLSECLDIVNGWKQTIEDAKQEEQNAKRWLSPQNERGDDYQMYGYCLKNSADLYQQNFCFNCNVYNIDSYNYSIPEDIAGIFVIMIDIHN